MVWNILGSVVVLSLITSTVFLAVVTGKAFRDE